MAVRSKRYKKELEELPEGAIGLTEAVEKVKSFSSTKFDQTVDCVINLGIDPKQADQLVRGSLSLPHGVGKQKKVVAFCEGPDVEAAQKAGAIEAGCDGYIEKPLNPRTIVSEITKFMK